MKLAVDAATGDGRADGLDARPARQALLQPRPLRRGRARVPARERGLPAATPTGSTRSPPAQAARGNAPRRRSPPSARAVELDPAAAVRRRARRPVRGRRQAGARAAAVRADRRDREAAARERRAHRPRDRALPGRPRHPPAATRSSSRADGRASGRRSTATTCSPGRSRATAVRRGAAVLAARAAARHAGRAEVLPPRDDRALPRARRRGADVVPARAGAEPALLACCGRRSRERYAR